MAHHDLKMWSGHFQHVVNGDMKADIRHTRDRVFKKGDSVTFHEIETIKDSYDVTFTGRDISAQLGYVSEHGMLPGHVCLSLTRVGLLIIK